MAKTVKTISYKGEQWPVRISYYAIKKFQEDTKKDISELDSDLTLLETLLWYGFIAGHTAEGKPMTLKRDEMEYVLDESLDEFNTILISFFPTPVKDDSKKK